MSQILRLESLELSARRSANRHIVDRLRTQLSMVCLMLLVGCPDSRPPSTSPLVKPDAGQPRTWVTVSPAHLTSGFATTETFVYLGVSPGPGLEPEVIEKQVTQAFSIVSLPGKVPVPGKLDFSDPFHTRVVFRPDMLVDDTEYLVTVKKVGYLEPLREHSLFHVGSLPRVRSMRATVSDKGTCDEIAVSFSEMVQTAKAQSGISVVDQASKATLASTVSLGTLSNDPSQTQVVMVRLSSPIPASTKLRITVGGSIATPAGLKLDGSYAGAAGSGDLVADFVPADHADAMHPWEPALSP